MYRTEVLLHTPRFVTASAMLAGACGSAATVLVTILMQVDHPARAVPVAVSLITAVGCAISCEVTRRTRLRSWLAISAGFAAIWTLESLLAYGSQWSSSVPITTLEAIAVAAPIAALVTISAGLLLSYYDSL